MEESRDKSSLVIDREPEGLSNVVESSHILEASHVREVSDALTVHTKYLTLGALSVGLHQLYLCLLSNLCEVVSDCCLISKS